MRPRWAKRTAFEKPRTARRRLADQSFQWLPRKVPNPRHLEKINCHTTTQARKTPTGLVLLPPRLVTLPRCQNFGSLHPPNTSIPPDPEPHQHGFRPLHSTTTALLEISSAVADGFNQKKPADRTVLVTLDLSKAFDMVCHRTLLEKLSRTSLPPSLTRWLSGYLTGRQARTLFRGETSPARIVRTGVPQGSVISPTLFNSCVGSLTSPPEGVNVVSYADDVTPWASGPKINIITAK